MLLTSRRRIIDIALESGFESQQSFSRAFKLAFQVTPAHYRKQGTRHQFLRKPKFDTEYLQQHLNANVSLEPELYEQPELLLVGMQTHFYGSESDKNNLAQKLPTLWSVFLARLGEVPATLAGCCYGVVRPRSDNADELEYLAAIAVRHEVARPSGMVLLRLPAGRYASWLARSGLRHSYAADIEVYGAEYRPSADNSVVHDAIPVHPAPQEDP